VHLLITQQSMMKPNFPPRDPALLPEGI